MESPLSFDPWFLAPPPEANHVVHTEYYIKHGEKKNIRRKIYERTEYDDFEKANIAEFKKYLATKGVTIPSSFRESSYLKMLQSGKFNLEKSLKALNSHVEWINSPKMHSLDEFSTAFLAQGNVYLCGRDKQFRPVIYMNCENLNLKKQGAENITRAMCVFLEMVKKHMFVDGRVENWRFIIDTKEKGVFDLPLKALGVIIDVMQVNFGGHLEKLYILNPSFGLSTMWSVIEKLIDEEAAAKIKFLKKKKLNELLEDIDAKYVEKQYTGSLNNLTQFWPPVDIYTSEEQKQAHRQKLEQKSRPPVAVVESKPAVVVAEKKQEIVIHQEQPQQQQQQQQPIQIGAPSPAAQQDKKVEQAPAVQAASIQDGHVKNPVESVPKDQKQQHEENENHQLNQSHHKQKAEGTEAHNSQRGNPSKEVKAAPQIDADAAAAEAEAAAAASATQPSKESPSKNYGAFEIKINKVEDVEFEYNNKNQYNEIIEGEEQQQQGEIQIHVKKESSPSRAMKSDEEEREDTNASPAAASTFKEIEQGIVLVHEEEEEGEQNDAGDVSTYMKQSKKANVYSKNQTFTQEDMKLIEIEEPKPDQKGGACCGSSSSCAIF